MLRIQRVQGESLSPEYIEGDFVVIATLPFFLRRLKTGDVIVFQDNTYGLLIKRVEGFEADGGILVGGTHAHSLSSRLLGPVRTEAVIGKVIWHIRRPTHN
jgi:signal peptidase I